MNGSSGSFSRRSAKPETWETRVSIFSIAHLGDAERMFIVTLVLNEMIAWMRQQSGTGSLRAILYMDEIFGYFPPVANPPSKTPLLTLLKQARAFGIGVVLAILTALNITDEFFRGLSALTNSSGTMSARAEALSVLTQLELATRP